MNIIFYHQKQLIMKLKFVFRNLTTSLLSILITFSIYAQPSNDECINATDISYAFEGDCGEITFNGPFDLAGATAGVNDPPKPYNRDFCGETIYAPPGTEIYSEFRDDAEVWENSIWFSFTVPDLNGDGSPVVYTFWTSDGLFEDDCGLNPQNNLGKKVDTQVAIYENNCPSSATEGCDYVAANDDFSFYSPYGFVTLSGFSDIELTPGVTYYMGVDGWDALEAEFCLTVSICGSTCGDDICNIDENYCDCDDCKTSKNGKATCPFAKVDAIKFTQNLPRLADGYHVSDDLTGNIFVCNEVVSGIGVTAGYTYLGFKVGERRNCSETSSIATVSLSVGRMVSSAAIENDDGTFNIEAGYVYFTELTEEDIAAGSITISATAADGIGNRCEGGLTINFADYPQVSDPYCPEDCNNCPSGGCNPGGIDNSLLINNVEVCENGSFTLSTDGTEEFKLCNIWTGANYVYGWRLLVEDDNELGKFVPVNSWKLWGTNPTIKASTFFIDENGVVAPDFAAGSSINPINPSTGELRKFQIESAALCFNPANNIVETCLSFNRGFGNSKINITYLPQNDSSCTEFAGENETSGCNDSAACNFNPNATTNDGSCYFPKPNSDCYGNCFLKPDCNGTCGGTAVRDCAGNCDGSRNAGSPCVDEFGNEGVYSRGCACLSNDISASIFDNYSWVVDKVNIANCEAVQSISEYQYLDGSTIFVYILNPNGLGTLYLDYGNRICRDSENYSCLEAYNLTQALDSWTCGGNSTESSEEPVGNEENEEMEEMEENEEVEEIAVFSKYSWLNNYINPNDCFGANKVTEFNFSSYSFVFVEDGDGGKLYFEDGTFYCASSTNYDCLALYGLNNPSANWACIDENENENESENENETENENENENTQDAIFSTYPWLSTLIDANDCSNAALAVYAYGTFEFISIENREGTNLYFQDGTFYCSDGLNYSCTNLYGLDTPKAEWECEGGVINQKQVAHFSQQKIDFDADFKIYPNPSNGKFMIEMEKSQTNTRLNIISIDGKLIHSSNVEPQQQIVHVEIDSAPKGIYLLQLIDVNNVIQQSQRIIVH